MTRTARREKKKHEDASSWGDLATVPKVAGGRVVKKKGKVKKSAKLNIIPDEDVDERRLKRRQKRRERRAYSKVCFKCRRPGHRLEDCTVEKEEDPSSSTNICFKCGSTEHSIKKCKALVPSGSFPFASCFICGETGHLSRSCPDNPRGLYPNGGGCKICGSVEHLKANCPEGKKDKDSSSIVKPTACIVSNTVSGDADTSDYQVVQDDDNNTVVPGTRKQSRKQSKQKIVKF